MLILISGASGVGKSSIRKKLAPKNFDNIVFLELSDLPCQKTVSVRNLHKQAEYVTGLSIDFSKRGKTIVFCGDPLTPGDIVATPSSREVKEFAACVLDVSKEEHAKRLRARGDPEHHIKRHLSFADFLRIHARDPNANLHKISDNGWSKMQWSRLKALSFNDARWKVPVIDTTGLSIEYAAEAVLQFIQEAIAGSEMTMRPSSWS